VALTDFHQTGKMEFHSGFGARHIRLSADGAFVFASCGRFMREFLPKLGREQKTRIRCAPLLAMPWLGGLIERCVDLIAYRCAAKVIASGSVPKKVLELLANTPDWSVFFED
jgi:hypothetical protein